MKPTKPKSKALDYQGHAAELKKEALSAEFVEVKHRGFDFATWV